MDKYEILNKVDHTALKAFVTNEEIDKLCQEAMDNKTASVCIPPNFVKRVKEKYKELNVCTVIGFPLGYNTTMCKIFEAREAIQNGATEIDMVINISDVKNNDFDSILEEIKEIRKITKGYILKVIVETCYLTKEEKIKLCECVSLAKADYIKTSTGFGTSGAMVEDIELFKQHIDESVKIKASGGIKTKEDLETFIELGCSRLGCSAAVDTLSK